MSEQQPERKIDLDVQMAEADVVLAAETEIVLAKWAILMGFGPDYDGPILGLGHQVGPATRPNDLNTAAEGQANTPIL